MRTANIRHFVQAWLGGSVVILTALVWYGDTNSLDIALRNWALNSNTSISVIVWESITLLGSVVVVGGLTLTSLGVLAARKQWQPARRLGLAMLGAVAWDNLVKWIIQRPRPDEFYPGTMPLTFSFPSGHALYSFTFYMMMASVITRHIHGAWVKCVWGIAFTLVLMIGASRIFLGVHYGTDVLAGYLIGATWLVFLLPIGNREPESFHFQ